MYYSQCVDQKLVRQPVGSVMLAGGQKRGEGGGQGRSEECRWDSNFAYFSSLQAFIAYLLPKWVSIKITFTVVKKLREKALNKKKAKKES